MKSLSKKKKTKISTFSRQLTPEEAEQEKALGTHLGEELKKTDEEYEKRKRGK